MIELKIIDYCDLIIDNNKYIINETYDIRFLRDIDDFKTTSCKCILLKITYKLFYLVRNKTNVGQFETIWA